MSTDKDSSAINQLRYRDLKSWLPDFMESKSMPAHRFGVAKLEKPISMGLYDQWLASGHHGEMSYLERHRDLKADPTKWLAFAKSALVFAISYGPILKSDYVTSNSSAESPLRLALYTRYAPDHSDYHDAIRTELDPVLRELEQRFPHAQFRLSIDAEPVLERDLAVRAGLGWVGKNTCVIDRRGGSLFFIAEILTSLETEAASLEMTDFCGTCTRCLDACPTQALIAPRILDAAKCISYWTIEAKSIPPKNLRSQFSDWFYGCDICQTVCPWNGKVFGRDLMQKESVNPTADSDPTRLARELKEVLESSNRELQRRFHGTPLARARAFGLKRNAMVIAANLKLKSLLPTIAGLFADERLGDFAHEIYTEIQS